MSKSKISLFSPRFIDKMIGFAARRFFSKKWGALIIGIANGNA
jgi:hypothetical protein